MCVYPARRDLLIRVFTSKFASSRAIGNIVLLCYLRIDVVRRYPFVVVVCIGRIKNQIVICPHQNGPVAHCDWNKAASAHNEVAYRPGGDQYQCNDDKQSDMFECLHPGKSSCQAKYNAPGKQKGGVE